MDFLEYAMKRTQKRYAKHLKKGASKNDRRDREHQAMRFERIVLSQIKQRWQS